MEEEGHTEKEGCQGEDYDKRKGKTRRDEEERKEGQRVRSNK